MRSAVGKTVRITSIEIRAGPEPVYNLEVAGKHVYSVTDSGLLVHNSGPCDLVPRGYYDSGYIGIVNGSADEFSDTLRATFGTSDVLPSSRLVSQADTVGLSASNKIPDNPYFTRIDPAIPGRPDPRFSIDSNTFKTGEITSKGGIRNTKEFWLQWQELRPESISESNRFLIENYDKLKVSPRIDDEWIKVFPEHSPFKDDVIIHHHVDFGQYVISVPGRTHVGSGGIWHTK